ncbi:enolase C-terminal domain-like protein [Saccharopolyspora sp. NPDC050642]|uniref:enolase C-terminal domain-like protein n=1 Tax=Saccharopolyspora sp. NPDC050642 TaxID=3157099 RepID=UPI0033D2D40A
MEDDRDADPPPAVERPAAVREAGGDQLDILLDLHSIASADTTIPVMQVVEHLGIMYCEEPTRPLNRVVPDAR